MGPLVYYCRWRGAKLRLRGRAEGVTWGQLVVADASGERVEEFRFDLTTWALTLDDGTGPHTIQLDELGVVVPPAETRPTTNSDVGP